MNAKKNKIFELIKMEYTLGHTATSLNSPTLNELAEKYKIPLENLKKLSAEEKWDELKNQNKTALTINQSHGLKADQDLENDAVRKGNFYAATVCLDRGLQKLSQLRDEEITPELALKMVQKGIKGRCDAAGLSDTVNVNTGSINLNFINEISVEDNINHQKQYHQLAKELNKYLDPENNCGAINVKPKSKN